MSIDKIIGAVVVAVMVIGIALFLKPQPMKAANTFPYIEIQNPSGFVNSEPFKLADIVGKKVILLDIMTYSCINCQRTYPYLKTWYETYKDKGFEIVAIHTPEFAFEKDKKNVEQAMKEFGLTFPVVLDNDYATWRAYRNQYWPRKYLIDISGNVVYDHIGEGGYEETEMKIRELLEERAKVLGKLETIPDAPSPVAKTAIGIGSPEVYFGSGRNEYLGNGQPGKNGVQNLVLPKESPKNILLLGGVWNFSPEYIEGKMESVIRYAFQSKEVYFVAESAEGATLEILLDGKPIDGLRGGDVSQEGMVQVKDSRLYHLVSLPNSSGHLLEIRVKSGTLKAYTFTFG